MFRMRNLLHCVLMMLALAWASASFAQSYQLCDTRPANYATCPGTLTWLPLGSRGVSGNGIRLAGPVWLAFDYVGATPANLRQCSVTVSGVGDSVCTNAGGTMAYLPYTFTAGTPTCTAPQILSGGSCVDCSAGTYYSGGSCVAEPTCTAPQILNTSTHTCVSCSAGTYYSGGSCVAEPTCIAPQVLNTSTHTCTSCSAGSYYSGGSCVAEPTCVAPQILNTSTHTCDACSAGNYYSGGSCVAEPTCIAPQVLDTGSHTCVNPPVTCTLPQVLQNGACVTPDPTCTLPQVLDPVNHVCYTPPVTCTLPQVLQNGVCVTPSVVTDCVPSARTVGNCPAGYAPASATFGQDVGSYSGLFDKMPIQDIIYVVGMALSGLLGIGVGVKLV